MTTTLVERTRESGKCPPNLISEANVVKEDGFDEAVMKALDGKGFHLAFEGEAANGFTSILQKASSFAKIPAPTVEQQKAALVQRRCILLAIVGSTPSSSPSLARVLSDGYLASVKGWLDEILNGLVGGVDLLLHLLSNIGDLPVTKTLVKGSGMGKQIGSIVKHSICAGTPNETAIKGRVQHLKDSWNASVKALKSQDASSDAKANVVKRPVDAAAAASPSAKRAKVSGDGKKGGSSLSSLLKKVSASSSGDKKLSSPDAKDADAKKGGAGADKSPSEKKSNKNLRVKWSDHFGGELAVSHVSPLLEGEDSGEAPKAIDSSVSWSDRKKRDRLREKELLSKMKKSKLLDDDDDDFGEMIKRETMQPKIAWHEPQLLPANPNLTPAQLESAEIGVQTERIKTIAPTNYVSDHDVPKSPAPLTDVEQALDMTSHSSVTVASLPFFVPQQPAPAAADPASSYAASAPAPAASYGTPSASSSTPTTGATPEFVQSLGLPMYLVGQNAQAVQTLANSPSLLSTLVDANGMYDQARLMSLVQTLSASQGAPAQSAPGSTMGLSQPGYQAASAVPYGASSSDPSSSMNSYRAVNSDLGGNLHLSGFGPMTTETDIINLFAPYVQVENVVMKGTFAFVNTSDPVNAQRAKEALNGMMLCGTPIRINDATRKTKTGGPPAVGASNTAATPSFTPSTYGGGGPPAAPTPMGMQQQQQGMPGMGMAPPDNGMVPPPVMNVDSIRDDRGNPATKNLFVAGYGHGTTEHQLRDLFAQYVPVIGVVCKGTFTFVNTVDREAAIRARQMLNGTTINGAGPVRINFAKETGRLGTSFDLTYGVNTGPNSRRHHGPGPGGPGPGGPGPGGPGPGGPGPGGPGPGGPGPGGPPPPNNNMSYYGRSY